MSQRKIERRALVDLGLGPDAPAVALDNALRERQPNARALEVLFTVQPLEHPKELVRIST